MRARLSGQGGPMPAPPGSDRAPGMGIVCIPEMSLVGRAEPTRKSDPRGANSGYAGRLMSPETEMNRLAREHKRGLEPMQRLCLGMMVLVLTLAVAGCGGRTENAATPKPGQVTPDFGVSAVDKMKSIGKTPPGLLAPNTKQAAAKK
jgi:hypothetical protein